MPNNFSHPWFEHFTMTSVPLNRDVFLMDESWMSEWESNYLDFFAKKTFQNVGKISYAAIRSATPDALEISWYPNIFDRFHEVTVLLPREAFVACIDVYDHDEKPHIFVTSEWLTNLHLRPYTAFALIDAIGVKQALLAGKLSGNKLLTLRDRIDEIADSTPGVAFVSFADSLLLKANWYVGQYDSDVNYSYEPEKLIHLFPRIAAVYKDILGMDIYATVTQGVNEYADSSLIHRSSTGSHVSLNSLGLPFAQLLAIDEAARKSIRSNHHGKFELYVDELFFHSLRFKYGYDKHAQLNSSYLTPMSASLGKYYCLSAEDILSNLDLDPYRVKPSKRPAS